MTLKQAQKWFSEYVKDLFGPEQKDIEFLKINCGIKNNDSIRIAFHKIVITIENIKRERELYSK